MALAFDPTNTIIQDGTPVIFPKDGAGEVAPMLSGVDSTGALRVVAVTEDGKLQVNANVTATLGETEIKNDTGNPIPVNGTAGDFPDATSATKLEEIKGKLDTIATNTQNIHLDVDTLEVNTDQLEAKLDTLIAKKGVSGSTDAFFSTDTMVALTNAFVQQLFGFTSFSISLTNDGAVTEGYIEYSFDGVTVHGRLMNGEGFAHDFRAQPGIYLRGQNGGEKYRLGAY